MNKIILTLIFSLFISFNSSALEEEKNPLPTTQPKNSQTVKLDVAKRQNTEMKAAQPDNFELKSFDWNGKIPQSRLVVLNNPYGSIRSRNHLEQKVFIHASIQEIGESPLSPEFKIREEDEKLFIDVVYDEALYDSDGKLRGRVDIAILFPGDVSIFAKTDFGMIKIDKTESHVQAESKSGEIKLTTTGLFSAKTDSGKINLRLRGFKEYGESLAESNTGKITASIFNDMDVAVKAITKNEILLNGSQKSSGVVYSKGKQVVDVGFNSNSGEIVIDIIEPPALVQSVKPSNAKVVNVDLRNLPKAKLWKPGDPVYDRDDKKNNNQK